jgi:hypothetical protein
MGRLSASFGSGGFNPVLRSRSRSSGRSGGSITTRLDGFAKPKRRKPKPPKPRTKPQRKAPIQTTALRSDQAPEQSKKPAPSQGAPQREAKAGDTIPIVFGKRANNVGGVWLQPHLSKQAQYHLIGNFLYPISQGELVSSPSKAFAYVGEERLQVHPDEANITLTHFHSTSAALAATPNACPITSGDGPNLGAQNSPAGSTALFCDFDTYTVEDVYKAGSVKYVQDGTLNYNWALDITVGTGDLTNTTLECLHSDTNVYELETGTDRTSEYRALLPATGFTQWNGQFLYNEETEEFDLVGGQPAGTKSVSIFINDPFETNSAGGTVTLIIHYTNITINTQTVSSKSATDSTIEAVREEYHYSAIADPENPPASSNYQEFADITFLQIRGDIYDVKTQSGVFPKTTRQLQIFYEQGVKVNLYSQAQVGGVYQTGASNQFVDLAMYMFSLLGRVDGATTAGIATPIDTSNLLDIASFCTNNGTFFNGVIDQQVNAIEYLTESAPFFLLRFISSNGRYSFQPILPITSGQQIDTTALTPAATFTDAEILPGSYSKTYAEAEQRREFIASVLWRRTEPGEIGSAASTTVRFSTTAIDAPVEQFDLSDCCTSSAHAEIFAKYQLAFQKHVTHSVSFAIPLDTTGLIPTQIIKIQRSRVSSVGDNRTEADHYQIETISHSTDGVTIIEAIHFPLNASNIAEISNEIVSGSFVVR